MTQDDTINQDEIEETEDGVTAFENDSDEQNDRDFSNLNNQEGSVEED